MLDFWAYELSGPGYLLHFETVLSLPPSVTKLVLWQFDKCVPAVVLPENIAIEHF